MGKRGFDTSRTACNIKDRRMNILGLDMSSQKSGYALFMDGQLVDYGMWQMTKDDEADWRKRIAWMADCVGQYCVENNVKEIYVEDVPPALDNSQTVKILSALQGMIIAVASLHDIDVHFVSVKTWKAKIGINLVSSKENNNCKKRIKEHFGKNATRPLNTVKGWVKGWEKKLSVDYANHVFGLDLVYKSPSSRFNQDDISDSINIAWSQIGKVQPYDLDTFKNIMNNFYDLITAKD